MIDLTLQEVAQIVGGSLHCVEDPHARVTGTVEFDSRKVTPGGIFVAIPGERVDGADFAAAAVRRGAIVTLAARALDVPSIVVPVREDHDAADAVVNALSELAREVTKRLITAGLTVVGVTGSAGKTSTKDLIAAVLSRRGATVAPPGSFNNELGHPYTALRCDYDTRYLVAEMSARGVGHIAHLARIAPPRVGAVLNVGSAHVGEFGSRSAIAQAKGELVEALPDAAHGGVAILNLDDDHVAGMNARTAARILTFSAATDGGDGGADATVQASNITLDDVARPSFDLALPHADTVRVNLSVFGAHQVSNALAAAAVAYSLGMNARDIAAGLSAATAGSVHRMDVRTRADGVTIINDSYNANPESMAAGITALGYTAARREQAWSCAILGPMGELGSEAAAEHAAVGAQLAAHGVDTLVAVGESPDIQALAQAAAAHGVEVLEAADAPAAAAAVQGRLAPGDVVLVKASNAQRLWRAAEALLECWPAGHETPAAFPENPGDSKTTSD